jgi:cell division GTPase FtsZ
MAKEEGRDKKMNIEQEIDELAQFRDKIKIQNEALQKILQKINATKDKSRRE